MTIRSASLIAVVLLLAGVAQAKNKKLKVVDNPGDVKPGKSALLKSPKGMHYFLRVPKKYSATKGARLVVFLHGSNMNGLSYLRSFEAKRWAPDAILCCPNGESGKGDPYGANNFTFGSAPFVAEITKAIQKDFNTTVTYVGGHSQGGFLTFSVILHFPELFHGAIPMAGDCWMQNEPNIWEKEPERLALQQKIAIAVIHGKADPVVKFSQGEHAYDVFRAMGYPKLRFFAPERLGHQFMLSPVDDALEWLDAMNGREQKRSLKLAGKWLKKGETGWVAAVAAAFPGPRTAKLLTRCEAAAAKATEAMRAQIAKGDAAQWIPAWLEFWRLHGTTQAAAPLVEEYNKKRAEQADVGRKLFREASGLFRASKRDQGKELLRQLLAEAPYTYEGYYAWKWLQEE